MSKRPEQAVPSEDRIREIAYKLWEEDGYSHGRDEEHWHRAVEIATAELSDPAWLQRQESVAGTTTANDTEAASDGAETTQKVEKLSRRKVA